MSITYEEALETLNSMFGSPWTTESLDTVLRHFEGHMENTIEAILGHGDGAPEELVKRLTTGGAGAGGPSSPPSSSSAPSANPGGVDISVDEEIARSLAAEEEAKGRRGAGASGGGRSAAGAGTSSGGGGAAPKKQRGRGTPTQLPADFLRIPGYKHRSGNSSSAAAGQDAVGLGGGGGIEDDERLARMLQDEMLQQELANNSEFSHLSSFGRARAPGQNTLRSSGFGGVGGGRPGGNAGGGGMEGPNIMEKLSDMGEQAKKRLAMFASQFNQQNGAAGGGGGGGFGSGFGTGNSRYFGAAPERNTAQQERRGLLDDNDDDGNIGDELSFGGTGPGAAGINSRASGRDVEMRNMGGGGPANKKMD